MSQTNVSPNPKSQLKPSLKKSSKADQSKSKKKQIEPNEELKDDKQFKKEHTLEDKMGPILRSKSSKKAALQLKGQSQFKEQVIEAEKSEKSAKVMKSTDKNTTIKENHNNVESNIRQFSHSRQNDDDHLELSKKKINTESKKSKIVESSSKHSKTQQKALNNNQIKEQKGLNIVCQNIKEKEQIQQVEKSNLHQETSQSNEENQENLASNTKIELAKMAKSNAKDTKMSKNLKRSQISKSEKDADENIQEAKKSKVKQSQSKSQAKSKSKDSKILQKKSGMKKSKLN